MLLDFVRSASCALLAAGLLALPTLSHAQAADPKGGDKGTQAAPAGDAAKDAKKVDEYAEAIRALAGPAANPECVWLGRRVVNLLWRDDLDTAFRHLDLYDRFGCPGNHVQATFRCVIRQGGIDPKATDALNARVHACWINPDLQPQAAAAATPAPAGQAGQPAEAAPAK
jgi:hypothetical protein